MWLLCSSSASTSKGATKAQREKLGISPAPKGGRSAPRTPPPEGASAIQQVEVSVNIFGYEEYGYMFSGVIDVGMITNTRLRRQSKMMLFQI